MHILHSGNIFFVNSVQSNPLFFNSQLIFLHQFCLRFGCFLYLFLHFAASCCQLTLIRLLNLSQFCLKLFFKFSSLLSDCHYFLALYDTLFGFLLDLGRFRSPSFDRMKIKVYWGFRNSSGKFDTNIIVNNWRFFRLFAQMVSWCIFGQRRSHSWRAIRYNRFIFVIYIISIVSGRSLSHSHQIVKLKWLGFSKCTFETFTVLAFIIEWVKSGVGKFGRLIFGNS